ncbi:MAG: Rab family GTPase [Thermoplasmata archaeon]
MRRTPGLSRKKLKICALGEGMVGKTSLIRRYVADKFEGDYTRTVGTLLSKKTLKLEEPGGHSVKVDAVIWDIMGQKGFVDLLKGAYFKEANGVFAVCDVTRRDTLEALHGWLFKVKSAAGNVPSVIMANKSDLLDRSQVRKKDLMKMSETYGSPYLLTSAKTGSNVPRAFESLVRAVLQRGKS